MRGEEPLAGIHPRNSRQALADNDKGQGQPPGDHPPACPPLEPSFPSALSCQVWGPGGYGRGLAGEGCSGPGWGPLPQGPSVPGLVTGAGSRSSRATRCAGEEGGWGLGDQESAAGHCGRWDRDPCLLWHQETPGRWVGDGGWRNSSWGGEGLLEEKPEHAREPRKTRGHSCSGKVTPW